ncbi:MAG TPA: YraN family protein [Anaerolineae bacterium]|nr:YraN family protein [Anaerolineae bacterium]
MKRHHIGAWGEDIASQYLEAKGYQIRARNWRTQEGELDLVAQDGETIVFVEVKTRTSKDFGWPEESVTPVKRHRLQRAALAYLLDQDLSDIFWRIDVVAIDRTSSGTVERLEHYIDAVDGEWDAP